MYAYSAYGLSIRSELELPELVATFTGGKTVAIHFGQVEPLPAEVDSQFHSYWATPFEACLCFQGIGAYLVRDGNEIVMQPAPNVEERVIRLAVLGPALSLLLHQRGLLVLHGSAVVVNGKAISFLGTSGEGKSTMAGALNSRGHSLIADDLSVVDFDSDGTPFLSPGFPQLKLWPEAVTSLGYDPDNLMRVHPSMEKRAHRINNADFSHEKLHLKRFYVLQEADSLSIEPLPSHQAFIELVRHSHNALLLDQTGATVRHFQQCVQLLSRVQMYRLNRPRILAALADVADRVEADLT